jgi:transcription antitermination factor NusG
MQKAGQNESWFALHTKLNRERHVAEMLRGKGYEEFVPSYRARRKWADRYKETDLPLFPGYVFCRFDPFRRLPILVTPGVVQVVGNGRVPAPIDDSEIEAIRAAASSSGVEPWPYLKVGERVRIESGPLTGLEGILQEVEKSCRIVISVSLLQRSVAVEVDRDRVRPIAATQHPAVMRAGTGPG